MKALVKLVEGPGLEFTDVPDPEPGPNDVVVRVLRTGICGTDLHIDAWDDWAAKTIRTPLVVGHEFAGEVVEIGQAVTATKIGDLVSGEGHLVCGTCRNCKAGRRHLCANTRGLGVHSNGAFAEYAVLPEQNVWVHRNPIDLDVAAIFDPFGNAVHTALSFPVIGEDVLITGAGPIGIMAAAVARHAGARNIAITDVSDHRLELAKRVGVDLALNVRHASIADAQTVLGMSEGFDVGMEMSGQPTAMRDMIANMSHGGRIAMLGLPAAEFPVDFSAVVLKMLHIKGIYGREMFETWYSMSVLLQAGLDLSPVITHRYKACEHDLAFATAREGNCGKIILDWTEN
ncbi:L-threonine 3-dehydrogenase [Kibdelosporangium phytohabitans]|uniref:L-threonine 3-dehydrogenase n=1 Tax=Kibdelosporangium phytohabitans TaxID=860235 RepID=A0A0N7F2Y6_9PSEU|nr:L-threonine 3-dehydrogenase [Kibdelosporangium phytohabitans]ALG07135.1 L-threonine 3-dehydrogenase [Kibdelosporangium phytohabitans]MBE1468459.1 threonine 3-dehydrogenase [Kibdelosporangium phytohabitans]